MEEQSKDQLELERVLSMSPSEAALVVGKVSVAAALAHIGTCPGIDGVVVALMDSVFRPIITNRFTNFCTSILTRLANLETQVLVNYNDEHFTTIYLQVAREAIATHDQDKIELLLNAVSNTALGIDIDEQMQLILVTVLADTSPIHVRILRDVSVQAMHYGIEAADQFDGSDLEYRLFALDVQTANSPSQRFQSSSLIKTLVQQLEARGLIAELTPSWNQTLTTEGFEAGSTRAREGKYHITELGLMLVRYVTDATDQPMSQDS